MTSEFEQNQADGEVQYKSKHKAFAVSFLSFHDNRLITEVVFAPDWRHASIGHVHTLFVDSDGNPNIDSVPDDVNEAREEAFNADGAFDVLELFINEGGEIDSVGYEHDNDLEDMTDELDGGETTNNDDLPANEEDEGDSYPADSKLGHEPDGNDTDNDETPGEMADRLKSNHD